MEDSIWTPARQPLVGIVDLAEDDPALKQDPLDESRRANATRMYFRYMDVLKDTVRGKRREEGEFNGPCCHRSDLHVL